MTGSAGIPAATMPKLECCAGSAAAASSCSARASPLQGEILDLVKYLSDASIAMKTQSPRKQRVAVVRRFNRFYTRQIGLLRKSYLDSPFSLGETRVLYELFHSRSLTASALARNLDLDAGYLSRV